MITTLLQRFGITMPPANTSRFPNLWLTTHRNRRVRFYDDVLKGKVVVVSFMYTRCEGICPSAVTAMRRLQEALGPRAGRDVFLYSITLDAAHDTRAVLARYAETIGAGAGWTLLTGDADDIDAIRRRLGFVDPDPIVDADKAQHAGLLLCGSEPADRWVATPAAVGTDRILTLLSRVA